MELVRISFPVPVSLFALKDVNGAPASSQMFAYVILGGLQKTARYNVSVMGIVTAPMKHSQTFVLNVITIPRYVGECYKATTFVCLFFEGEGRGFDLASCKYYRSTLYCYTLKNAL